MLKKIYRFTAILTVFAVWSAFSMVAFAMPLDVTGIITATGNVTVNGQLVVSGSTIVSGSSIETGAGATAVITINKVGKIELAPETSLTLRFTESTLVGIVNSGKVTVYNAAGIATTFTTKDATVIADSGQANNFVVEVECSHTHVDTITGLVTMRTGTTDKQVAAGMEAVAGNMQNPDCKPCFRPGGTIPTPVTGIGSGALTALLIGIAGAVITGIILGTQGTDVTPSGGTTVVSPTR
ncbi:MAG: hypothetical protein D6687_06515 [Acidobacteria bacterium]|nr:MAG: hypothetical protein D6687_06515 [Acidobacteriota bacterium]GIU82555.1 MAG: hypothetical protein KatS3mg006_1619 [Pyrinomonadaceae bacterium]